MKKIIIFIAVFIMFLSGYFLFRKQHFLTEEARVKHTISQAEKAIKERNIPELLSCISYDYKDDFGNNKMSLAIFLRSVFNEYPVLYLYISGMNIRVKGTEAEVTFIVTVFARKEGEPVKDIIKDRTGALVKLKKEGRIWRIVSAGEAEYTFD